jgi:probable phosphoglycerate mutase
MSGEIQWPARLWIVRHGESAGNLAWLKAQAENSQRIGIEERDMDVELSELGRRQSRSVGQWFGDLPGNDRPNLVLSSPFRRTRETAELMVNAMGGGGFGPVLFDERLREKEFGALDRLTKTGIEALFPDQAKLRTALGKFYYRPPSGESWCDVILRLRGALETICLHYTGKRVVVVTHQVVVLCFRYLLESLDEYQLLAIDRAGDVGNCAITEYTVTSTKVRGGMELRRYNFVAPLREAGTPVTAEPSKGGHLE